MRLLLMISLFRSFPLHNIADDPGNSQLHMHAYIWRHTHTRTRTNTLTAVFFRL